MVLCLPTQGQVGCTVRTRWRATCHGDGWSQRTDTSGRSSARQAPLPLDERGGKRRPRSQEDIGLVDAKDTLAQKIMGQLFGVTKFHCILCGGQPLGPKQRNTRNNNAFRRDCRHFRVCQAWMKPLDQVSGHKRPMPRRQACSRLTLGAKHRHWSGHDGQDHSEAERPACAPNDLSRPA
jgi:hypothetical protein